MAFLKKARAQVIHPQFQPQQWGRVRTASVTKAGSDNLVAQASEILKEQFDPEKYLLTHATIVASVDVEEVPGVKMGTIKELGRDIHRKWADYRVTPETDKFINNNCFVPGTLITMADGTVKPIEEVREGDEVLTHRGRSKRVRALMRREVDEEIFEIHPRATTERVYATGEHPFFVFRENACANCGVPARSKSSYNARCVTHLIGKFYCSRECWYEKKIRKSQLLAEKEGEFVEAQHLTDRDFITTPLVTETGRVDLTLGQARLIGLFVAEGYYELDSRNDRVGAMWAFHSDEAPTLAKTVCALMRAEFGVECVVRDHKGDLGIHVTTRTNRDVADFFSRWVLGAGSTTKTLHPDLLRAEQAIQMEIVRGWVEGDGCLQDTATDDTAGDVRLTCTTASRSLASQMQIVLRRLGVSSHLTRTETAGRARLLLDGEMRVVNDEAKPKNVSWAVGCGAAWIDELVQETVYEDGYLRAVERRGGLQQAPALRFLNGYELQIIQSVRRVAYSGPVFNFDVEEDHSYVANGVAVHNCDAWARDVLLKSYRTFVGAHNFCFAPGTSVLLADGTYKAIEDMSIGDEVVTHKGRVRRVTHKFERDYEGPIEEVYFDRFKRPILATPNHPFRTISVEAPPLTTHEGSSLSSQARYRRDKIAKALRGQDVFQSGLLSRLVEVFRNGAMTEREIVEQGVSISGARKALERLPQFFHRRAMTESEKNSRTPRSRRSKIWELREDAPLGLTRPFTAQKAWSSAGTLGDGDFVLGAERAVQGSESAIPEATLLGYYMAEGCLIGTVEKPGGFVLSFGPHERNLAEHAQSICREMFPQAASNISSTQTSLRVNVCAKAAGEWAEKMGGHLAHLKRLHLSVFEWDCETLLHLLAAWMSGDGNVHQETFRLRGTSVSENLAHQMQFVAERVGVKSFVVFEKRKVGEAVSQVTLTVGGEPRSFDVIPRHHSWTVTVSKDSTHEVSTRSKRWPSLRRVAEKREKREKRDDLAWWGDCRVHRVHERRTTPYMGKVYNLEVEEDHSYVVDHGIAVHNCEHVQIEEQSKGRIIDAAARDIGDSIYVDILIATSLKHASLIEDIKAGKMGTLSMGCFLAGTQVTMGDGTRVAIEDVAPGDMVLTHKGRVREVLNKQIRTYRGELRYIKAVGVSSTIRATANHGFHVLRAPTVYNPNNTYSLAEARSRKTEVESLKEFSFEKTRADELSVGDFLAFPRSAEGVGDGWTAGKARLIGYFLAEGSFLKSKGEHVEVQFNFSMGERDLYAQEVVDLLGQEFPGANEPWVQERPDRDTFVVHMTGREAVAWFLQHCGEYSHGKRMSPEVVALPVEFHKHLVGAWINGDANKTLSGTTVSYDLACQMHHLLSRCGVFARMECQQDGRNIEIAQAVGSDWMPNPETGKRPAITLVMGLTGQQGLAGFSDKVGRESQAEQQLRMLDDYVIFPVTSIESDWYEGPVHNMEVDEDHTYVVEGVTAYNCSVTDTVCTKCGNVAADETQMCFPPGTRVLLADGRYVPIEEIVEGDTVVTHTGETHAVTETMQRQYDGHLVSLDVDGIPVGIRSTPNHPYWVLRPAQVCACGCEESLRRTVEHERGSVKAFQRRFLPGHNTRLRNPNSYAENVVAFEDYEQLFDVDLEFVEARDLNPGDYLAFPIPQGSENTGDATVNRARLIGYFLAEGSFIKREGEKVGVSFTFGHHEYETLAAEVETLLNVEFGRTERSVQAHRNRNSGGDEQSGSVDVRFMDADVAEFFFRYCGEYSNEKRLDASVLRWEPALQKHVLFGWLGGDGTQAEMGIVGNTASFNLLSQMHILAARCDLYAYKKITFGGKTATLNQVVNGDGSVTVRDHRGWLPSFGLVVSDPQGFNDEVRFSDRETARVTMSSITDSFKRVGNWLIYRIRDVACEPYSGVVHNFEVEKDHSYVVEGLAVHNCEHIKYHKGNYEFDQKGTKYRIAELCGHPSIDPTGGVHFIEASWVATPAFAGAVLRNVLEPEVLNIQTEQQIRQILASPPPAWTTPPEGEMTKAARMSFDFGEEDGGGGGDAGGDAGGKAPPAAPPSGNPLEGIEKELEELVLNNVKKRIKEKLQKDVEQDAASDGELATSTNDNLQHQASLMEKRAVQYRTGVATLIRVSRSDVELIDNLARLNQRLGVKVSREVYLTSLRVGSTAGHSSFDSYLMACQKVLARKPTLGEAKTLVRLGQILSLRK